MTKEELIALVDAKITGQGSAVDAGGALPEILKGLIELIPEGGSIPVASADTLGGVKVGKGLSATPEGVLSTEEPLQVYGELEKDGVGNMSGVFRPTPGQSVTSYEAFLHFRANKPVILWCALTPDLYPQPHRVLWTTDYQELVILEQDIDDSSDFIAYRWKD